MFVAFLPVAAKLLDRGSQTTVAVVASDAELNERTRGVLQTLLDGSGSGFVLVEGTTEQDAVSRVLERDLDAAIVAIRRDDGSLSFSFHLGETMGQQQISNLSLGVFGVAVLDYSARNPVSG